MFNSSDFLVIGMSMLALVFFMWYAVAGITKAQKRADDQQPKTHADAGKQE